jgi:hypothetical protein
MATRNVRAKETKSALKEKLPEVWPFPTYKGQPYKAPRKKRFKVSDVPDALF